MAFIAALMLALFPGDLLISEIMYNPDGTSMGPDELLEWIELYNSGDETMNLRGIVIMDESNSLELGDYLIQPNEYVVVSASSGAFIELYGPDIPLVDWTGDPAGGSRAASRRGGPRTRLRGPHHILQGQS